MSKETTTKETITKDKLVKNLQIKLGFSAQLCEEIINQILSEIIALAKRDDKIMIKNFGTWKIKQKQARPGFNINKKEATEVNARSVLSFTPANNLRKLVNPSIAETKTSAK